METAPGVPGEARPEDQALVRSLMEVIAGKAPLHRAAELLAPGVVCHMDRFRTRGIGTWAAWVSFLHSRGVEGLEPVVERVTADPGGTVTAHGRFRGRRGGRVVEGGDGGATYRIAEGRIVEIWTTRHNYELLFGWRARYALPWLLVLLHMALWSRLPGRPRWSAAGRTALHPEPREDVK